MDGDGNGFSEERLERIHEIINRRQKGGPVSFERVREVLDVDFYYELFFEAAQEARQRYDTGAGGRREKILDSLDKSFRQIERDLQELNELDPPMGRLFMRNIARSGRFRYASTAFSHFSLDCQRAVRSARAYRSAPANRPTDAAINRMLSMCAAAATEITGDAKLTSGANTWFIKFCYEAISEVLGPYRLSKNAIDNRWREMK